jgi:hypothetical protein
MAARPPTDRPTHAERAAEIPAAPPDEANEAVIFARKTLVWTFRLILGFIVAAVVYTFIMQ